MACRITMSLLCFALVSGVCALVPKPCCWVEQMTGLAEMQSMVKEAGSPAVIVEKEYEWAYDEPNHAQAFIYSDLYENGTTSSERVVKFYDRGLAYTIQGAKGKETCIKKTIPARFPTKCIPDNAAYDGNRILGNDALVSYNWKVNGVAGGITHNATFSVDESCAPISFALFTQEPEVITIAYGGLIAGFRDKKKYFKVPDDCKFAPPSQNANKYQDILETAFNM